MSHHKEDYDRASDMRGSDPELGIGRGAPLMPTQTNLTITPEMFEALYLAPKNRVSGDLRTTVGNPTPVGVMGFIVALTPLSIAYMGWRGSGGSGIATTTVSLWFGGFLLILAGLGEFLLGNTFPMLVFFGYGAHFLTYSTTFLPFFNAINTFDTTQTNTLTPTFLASFAFYPISMCVLSFIFLIGSTRTNGIFFFVFVFATIGFGTAAGAFFNLALGNTTRGTQLVVITGAFFFAAALLGWYLFLAIVCATMELPIPGIPVFDLSTVIKPKKNATEPKVRAED